MLLDDVKNAEPIISAQLKNCGNHQFLVIDENNQTYKLNIDKKNIVPTNYSGHPCILLQRKNYGFQLQKNLIN